MLLTCKINKTMQCETIHDNDHLVIAHGDLNMEVSSTLSCGSLVVQCTFTPIIKVENK